MEWLFSSFNMILIQTLDHRHNTGKTKSKTNIGFHHISEIIRTVIHNFHRINKTTHTQKSEKK